MEIFTDSTSAMTLGERAALAGVMGQLDLQLALQIGADGGSLRRLAASAAEVHHFSRDSSVPEAAVPADVRSHASEAEDSLAAALAAFAETGRNVDFVLLGGARSAAGMRADLEALLGSPALGEAVVLVHGSTDESVRGGLDAVHFTAHPKVAHVDLDFVPGHIIRERARRHELAGGLALVVVDSGRSAYFPDQPVIEERFYGSGSVLPDARDAIVARESERPTTGLEVERQRRLGDELVAVRGERDHYRNLSDTIIGSFSWKLTAPLRAALAKARGALARATSGN